MRILDRYILRNFLVPFIYCFLGFIAIWLIFDLSDNGPDFIEAKVPPAKVALFYLTQLPQTVVICLPVGLLLALLYSLSRMSRFNEIISILGAGQSIVRLLYPLLAAGLVATGVCIALNYQLAPHAEGIKKQLLDQFVKGSDKRAIVSGQLFRDRTNARTWYVQKIRLAANELIGLHITQQNAAGDVERKYYARRATFNEKTKTWTLERGKIVDFNAEGDKTNDQDWDNYVITGWTETPWRIASSNLEAQSLSVPELQDYLQFNSDFPRGQLAPYRTHLQYRWALPWSCFVVILIGAPLGIVYSRRGVLAGVASSLVIFFSMIFLTNLFLALGKGDRISPTVAAWAPNAFFAVVGLFLLHLRSSNRELPRLKFGRAAVVGKRPPSTRGGGGEGQRTPTPILADANI